MINRRSLLKSSLLCSAYFAPTYFSFAKTQPNVVIIGGGWGGLSAAKTLRSLNSEINITLIEKEQSFVSCPISNWVIGQIKEMKDITFSYDKFIKNNRIKLIHDTVNSIDTNKKLLVFNDSKIYYDKLVLSPGVELQNSSIEGLEQSLKNNSVFTAWKAGKETNAFSKRIKNLNDNENIIISIPLSPYRCPPGPYERASLIANYIKKNNLKNKVLVLDANQKIVSKEKLFRKAWKDLYSNIIDYRTDSNVREIDSKNKLVITDFDEFNYGIANLIPNQQAPNILFQAGLIEKNRKWASVNSYDFTSSLAKDIYVIGDSTDRVSVGSVPKSGYIAYSMGKVCGYAVHNALLDKNPPSPSMINTCYSLVSQNEGISVSAVYKHDKNKNKIVTIKDASGVSPNRSEIIAYNAWDWAQAIWHDMLT